MEAGGPAAHNPKSAKARPSWIPQGMEPILEELPKWNLLAEILQEAEEEMLRQESIRKPITSPNIGNNIVLVMTSSTRTCSTLTDFLSSIEHDSPPGTKGRNMMLRKLKTYLWWKAKLLKEKNEGKSEMPFPNLFSRDDRSAENPPPGEKDNISEALKRKDQEKANRAASRRRVRGGAPAAAPSGREPSVPKTGPPDPAMGGIQTEVDAFEKFWESQGGSLELLPQDPTGEDLVLLDIDSGTFSEQFDANYGLVAPEETVIIRAYSDDTDDRMLAEIQPKFIVMFEPNMEFIRRIEVYKSSHPGLAVRVYHMVYSNSCEEHKYLAGIRREKDAFERLIKERGVIVDMREFRSSLPSILHATNMLVIPATLTVGDYIITPEICIERKSLSDLISSFNSGRLYTQCELMSVHYKSPMLLIEFEEDKAFTLDVVSDIKSYVKPTGKYPVKKKQGGVNAAAEELLRCLPGITAKNIKHVMNKINTVRELCDMDLVGVQELLGAEPGKACYDFMHKGENNKDR
ncbi:hypothetical protein H0H93_015391 [Arthromyces matolae]|nr:hypothetical protein H0H93_015391 [Arthromyces matolae]